MRRMISQKLIEFLKKLASLIGFTGEKIEVGEDLEVDGDIILNDADNLVDKDGNKLIPAIPTPTKLYRHNIFFRIDIDDAETGFYFSFITSSSVLFQRLSEINFEIAGYYPFMTTGSASKKIAILDTESALIYIDNLELDFGGVYDFSDEVYEV